jgi:tetratricopeptide (TPR) repeat protein
MTFAATDPEKILGDAIDLIADLRQEEAEEMLNAFAAALKAAMNGSDADAGRYYWWGRALSLMDEWEQALLRFESAIQINPDHEAALWETAVILMDELDRPESAKAILQERLLKLKPGHPDYAEALSSAEVLIRRRDGRKLKPWKEGEVEEAEAEDPETAEGMEDPGDPGKA